MHCIEFYEKRIVFLVIPSVNIKMLPISVINWTLLIKVTIGNAQRLLEKRGDHISGTDHLLLLKQLWQL